MKLEPIRWVDGRHGGEVPRRFARSFRNRAEQVEGVDDENWARLERGPGDQYYLYAWIAVAAAATVTLGTARYCVRQLDEGDVWLVPVGMAWDEDTQRFVWPDADEYADEDDYQLPALSPSPPAPPLAPPAVPLTWLRLAILVGLAPFMAAGVLFGLACAVGTIFMHILVPAVIGWWVLKWLLFS
jgi:hypothetical protein